MLRLTVWKYRAQWPLSSIMVQETKIKGGREAKQKFGIAAGTVTFGYVTFLHYFVKHFWPGELVKKFSFLFSFFFLVCWQCLLLESDSGKQGELGKAYGYNGSISKTFFMLSCFQSAIPNSARTLIKLSTELRWRNVASKHRLSMQIGAKGANTCVQRVYIPTELSFCIPPLVVGYKQEGQKRSNWRDKSVIEKLPHTDSHTKKTRRKLPSSPTCFFTIFFFYTDTVNLIVAEWFFAYWRRRRRNCTCMIHVRTLFWEEGKGGGERYKIFTTTLQKSKVFSRKMPSKDEARW